MFTSLLIIIVIALLIYVFVAYNSLVRQRNQASEAWSDIDVQLKRRHNLIPNLVETVKGYAAHESGTLESVTKARAEALSAQTPAEHAQAENALSSTLKTLFAVSEQYPDLKANTNFLELQRQLSDTEDKIQAAYRFYNGVVRDYNTAVETMPNNIIASMFHFTKRDFFELETPTDREVPQVDFTKK
ncbi:MAG TPA: LemA family protein [Candidatus Andersenbacteria bacterium]|nr:LemA family protein [Candidatus Andersenbacteria bacterium]